MRGFTHRHNAGTHRRESLEAPVVEFDLLIRNGRVVDPLAGVRAATVGLRAGRIAALLAPDVIAHGREEVDAAGRPVFPGVIEPHTHLGYKRRFADDVRTETASAALGGITTVMTFHRHYQSAEPRPYDDFPELVATVEREAHVDVALHFGILTESQLRELDKYVEWGVSSFKFYMAYRGADGRNVGMVNECDDGLMLEGFRALARHPHAVACVHCENTEVIGRYVRRVRGSGRADLAAWNASRPAFAEAENVRRAAYFAEQAGCTLYYVHIGARESLDEALACRARYPRLIVETCSHYLTHTEDSEVGALGKVNPPLRAAPDVAAMWRGLKTGTIDTVGTDHCATTRAEKQGDIWQAMPGFPGMATSLPVLLSEGVGKHGLSLSDVARLSSYNVARAFNLYPRKGRIEVGADADLVVVDLDRARTVRAADLGSASDFSLYDGWTLKGWPVTTIVRGQVVARDGSVVAKAGTGRFVGR
jgi:dihydropyrimidinase